MTAGITATNSAVTLPDSGAPSTAERQRTLHEIQQDAADLVASENGDEESGECHSRHHPPTPSFPAFEFQLDAPRAA